jgi:hypothetical protein
MKYSYTIEEGDVFECLKDYVMDDGEVAYTKGHLYTSDFYDSIEDNQNCTHNMADQKDFFEYFKLLTK